MFRLILLRVVIIIILLVPTCYAEDFHCGEAAAGYEDGSSWANQWACSAVFAGSSTYWASTDTAGKIDAGDTLYIDGGAGGITYTSGLKVGASGSSGSVISIKPGAAHPTASAGHNGLVTITNTAYDETFYGHGIFLAGKSYVIIDGNDGAGNRKIQLTGSIYTGLSVSVGTTVGNIVRYLQIDHNGTSGAAYQKNNILIDNIPSTGSTQSLLELSNCLIDHPGNDNIRILGNGYSATAYDRILIHDNEITNTVDDGVECGAAGGVSFYDNYMHGMAADAGGHPDGFVSNGCYYLKVYNNKIENMLRQDKHLSSYLLISAQTTSDVVEVNNVLVYNNLLTQENFADWIITEDSAESTCRGIEITPGPSSSATAMRNWTIANNTIIGMPFYGLSFYIKEGWDGDDVDNIVIINNIISDCSRANSGAPGAISVGDVSAITVGNWGGGTDLIFDYNVFYAGDYGYTNGTWGDTYRGAYSNVRTACACQSNDASSPVDPSFSVTYELNAGSPAIDRGVNLDTSFTTDKAGVDRGDLWDIGAYEYTSGSVYTLTVSKAGSGTGTVTSDVTGIDCGATCTYDYDGTVVTLTATATSPNYFAGWSGEGCSGTSTCQVTMSAAKSVTATFPRYGVGTIGAGGLITFGTGGSMMLQ